MSQFSMFSRPNEVLLADADADAVLAINAVGTVLRYID